MQITKDTRAARIHRASAPAPERMAEAVEDYGGGSGTGIWTSWFTADRMAQYHLRRRQRGGGRGLRSRRPSGGEGWVT
jgi:hypothetical protein